METQISRPWPEVFAEDLQRVKEKVKRDQWEYNNLCMIWEEASPAKRIEMLPDLLPSQLDIPDYPTAEGQSIINRVLRRHGQQVRPAKLTETKRAPIIRDYKDFVVMAQSESDYQGKCKRIDQGDTRGFYPVAARSTINFEQTNR